MSDYGELAGRLRDAERDAPIGWWGVCDEAAAVIERLCVERDEARADVERLRPAADAFDEAMTEGLSTAITEMARWEHDDALAEAVARAEKAEAALRPFVEYYQGGDDVLPEEYEAAERALSGAAAAPERETP